MGLLALPEEVLLVVLRWLSSTDLASLSSTNKIFYELVENRGWKDYVRLHPRPHISLLNAVYDWEAKAQIRYNTFTDRSWMRGDVTSHRLSRPWAGKLQSVMAICPSRMVVAAGDTVYSYFFARSSPPMQSPDVHLECTFHVPYSQAPEIRRDVSSIAFLPDDGQDRTLCIGFVDGAVERVVIPLTDLPHARLSIPQASRILMDYTAGDLVSSLSISSGYALSLTSSGRANLQDAYDSALDSPLSTTYLDVEKKAWVAHLSPLATYAAFGTSSSKPLSIHAVTEAGLTSKPTCVLLGGKSKNPAVYGICSTPSGAPWGATERIVVSGWFDGVVRVHDLRLGPRVGISTNNGSGPEGLNPVLALWDPWSYEPVYAVSFGGGACSHAAAGSARHSLVAFWDVRFSSTSSTSASGSRKSNGWSVYAPGSENSSSPVYALHLESARAFGSTQSAPFVLDFGPGVGYGTYDDVPMDEPRGPLRGRRTATVTQITKYLHSTGSVDH